ncbi:MAG: hypothetical protein KME28_21455 [Pelatocladus maniniholoensis HA4357-MV3]|uniref:Uncharacterized protein n=1 Tax=Pelatocladus maniniholoensis HA4357-MV3 TaxID=1117104 RepID=A0A9E3HB25_9NOST|nr:hypothetical protein [Pelatocladus maniniholoensis HA4357-MV3]
MNFLLINFLSASLSYGYVDRVSRRTPIEHEAMRSPLPHSCLNQSVQNV